MESRTHLLSILTKEVYKMAEAFLMTHNGDGGGDEWLEEFIPADKITVGDGGTIEFDLPDGLTTNDYWWGNIIVIGKSTSRSGDYIYYRDIVAAAGVSCRPGSGLYCPLGHGAYSYTLFQYGYFNSETGSGSYKLNDPIVKITDTRLRMYTGCSNPSITIDKNSITALVRIKPGNEIP